MKRSAAGRNRGFTLIEIMVVISIILILLSVAMPIYSHSLTRQREQNLRQNLATLNRVIVQYTLDKQKPPKSLEDLVQAKYIKNVPDDITGRVDTWQTEPADAIMSLEQTDTDGIIGVHSGSNQIGSDGTAYSSW
ncbi:MAG: type II secretion system GspH family protein [Acidobacteriia bacterium]|nr:type II secretion system GspH family protein [Terriglobia bacterium]